MIIVVNKLKEKRAYQLDCAIPLVGAKAEVTKEGHHKFPSERVLTMLPLQKRFGLPDSVAQSESIVRAVAKGWLTIKTYQAKKASTVGAKPLAASKKKETVNE